MGNREKSAQHKEKLRLIIWSWDTVKETTADGMLAAAFVILYSGVLLFILYFCFSALTDLQKPDERKSDERNEDE
ncbi:conjugal transfer protein TrbE [Escherichia coli]|nr:conjugal transfer protein TrbE [Escherichia coli]